MAGDKLIIEVDAKTLYDGITNLSTKLDEVIEHAKKTNGRVTKTEEDVEKLKSFQTKAIAFVSAIAVVANYVIPKLLEKLIS